MPASSSSMRVSWEGWVERKAGGWPPPAAPERNAGARIKAGLRHQIAADASRLALVGSAVGQQHAILGADT